MTIQKVPPIWIPGINDLQSAALATSTAITASGHRITFVFEIPKTGTISAIGFRTSTISGTASVDVRLESVTSGRTSTNLIAAGSNGASGTIVSNTNYEVSLTTPLSVTKGDLVALSFAYSAGTSITLAVASGPYNSVNFPSLFVDVGAGPVATSTRSPNFVLKYNDATYETPFGCSWSTSGQTVSSTFSTGEVGARFRPQGKIRVTGAWFAFDPDIDLAVNIRTDSGLASSTLGTSLIAKTFVAANAETANIQINIITFNTTLNLDANTWYKYTVGVAGASSRFWYSDVPTNAQFSNSAFGVDFYLAQWNGSVWAETQTRVPQMGLIIDGLDDGVAVASGGCPLVGNEGLIY